MKKLLYTLFAVSLIFAACKKEEGCTDSVATNFNADADKDDGSCTYSILGGWEFIEMNYSETEGYYTSYPNGKKVVTYSISEIMIPGDTSWGIASTYINFKSDGTLKETTTILDGSIYDITYTWIKNGNLLTINDSIDLEINTLTSSTLKYSKNELDTFTHYGNPILNDTVYFNEFENKIEFKREDFPLDNSNSKMIKGSNKSLFKTFINRKRK